MVTIADVRVTEWRNAVKLPMLDFFSACATIRTVVYLWSAVAVIAGTLLIIYTEWIVNNVGRIAWAEQHLGTEGGTRIFYKLLGVLIILGAFLAVTGTLGDLLLGIFAPKAP
jgi:hypothetical protein